MSLSPDELGALAQKYDTLGELRRARSGGAAVPPAGVFRALARAFPGCLNELDTLPLDTIDARAAALRGAAAGAPLEAWMEWVHGYHALLRAALALKPRVRRGAGLDEARAEALARRASKEASIALDAAFVRAVANPPSGRLVVVVLAHLEALHGVPREAIKSAIFPRARRSAGVEPR
jgi:hypothetical protein